MPTPPQSGYLLGNKWILINKIGKGAFGEIFIAECRLPQDINYGKLVALKIEILKEATQEMIETDLKGKSNDAIQVKTTLPEDSSVSHTVPNPIPVYVVKPIVKNESNFLSQLQIYSCVPRVFEFGTDGPLRMAYIAMELLGDNLSVLRRNQKNKRFSLATVLRFGMQAIKALQSVHGAGIIHRDIKPSNFVIGVGHNTCRIYLVDFGLSRRFRDETNIVLLKKREKIVGIRGTPFYASLNSHHQEDLSPRDDLWALLYILIEFSTGTLPWKDSENLETIKLKKETYHTCPDKLFKNCPACYTAIFTHLNELTFYSTPDYNLCYHLLETALQEHVTTTTTDFLYDWEKKEAKQSLSLKRIFRKQKSQS